MGQFAKFRSSPRQNGPNSTVYRSLSFCLKNSLCGCWHGTQLC